MDVTTADGLVDTDGTEPPSKRERNKADKRRRIVDAARRLFRERGFDDVTTAEISAAAGIGTGTLYLYVDSKEDLLVEVFLGDANRAWTEAIAGIDRDDEVADQIITAFCHVADFHLREPGLSRASFRELPFTTGSVRHRCSAFQSDLDARLAGVLEEAKRRGRLTADVDHHALATNLFAAWYVQMQRRLGRGLDDDLHRSLERSVRTALAGLT